MYIYSALGTAFRQIQQRYEPHPGTLRAIEIVENSPTYSERPQPAAHASRDRSNNRKHSEGLKETAGRRKVGFCDLNREIFLGRLFFRYWYYGTMVYYSYVK